MYDVITIGGAVRDFTFYTEIDKRMKKGKYTCFLRGVKINVKEIYFTSGGGACNLAVGLKNFGLKVAPIIRVGKSYHGQVIIDDLKKKKIETKYIQIDPKLRTGISSVIQPNSSDRTILTYRGANDKLEIKSEKLKTIRTKWIYLASLSGNWQETLNQVFNCKSKKPGLGIAWNPGLLQLKAGKKRLARFLKQTELLIVNKTEGNILTGQDENNIPALLKSLYKLGPKIVVITCGKGGAYVMDKNKIFYEPSRAKKVIDTTGAGDSFSSGFLAGLILFNDVKKALKLGILNSAANLAKVGAQEGLLTKKELKKLRL